MVEGAQYPFGLSLLLKHSNLFSFKIRSPESLDLGFNREAHDP
jgi:hypothetical protein